MEPLPTPADGAEGEVMLDVEVVTGGLPEGRNIKVCLGFPRISPHKARCTIFDAVSEDNTNNPV